MIVLVCGGRDFADWRRIYERLDVFVNPTITKIVHGGSRGADSIAGHWANARGIECKVYPADWEKLGRQAGAIRNAQILHDSKPDLVVAFPGGPGTRDMVRRAKAQHITVIEG